MAVSSPLMETSINGARGVLINITGSEDMDLEDVETAANLVQEAAHPDANIIFGASFDANLQDEIRVTVIATGFEEGAAAAAPAAAAAGIRPVSMNKDKPQGLFTGAAEKAAAAAPSPINIPLAEERVFPAAPVAPVAPVAPAAPAAPAEPAEDPFDSIFKIFNTK